MQESVQLPTKLYRISYRYCFIFTLIISLLLHRYNCRLYIQFQGSSHSQHRPDGVVQHRHGLHAGPAASPNGANNLQFHRFCHQTGWLFLEWPDNRKLWGKMGESCIDNPHYMTLHLYFWFEICINNVAKQVLRIYMTFLNVFRRCAWVHALMIQPQNFFPTSPRLSTALHLIPPTR